MLQSTCHRCGARAPRGPSRRAICSRCAVSSSPRTSAPDLEELTRGAGGARDERVSLEWLAVVDTGLAAPVIDKHRPRSARWSLVAGILVLGAVLGATGTTAVQHVLAGDAKPEALLIVHRKTGAEPQEMLPELVDQTSPSTDASPAEASLVPEPSMDPAQEASEREPEPPRPALRNARRTNATSRPSTPATSVAVSEPTPVVAPERLSPLPDRASVRAAFTRIHDGVQACGDVEQIGTTVVARVVFSGDTGRVRHAQVVDANVPPAVRSCVARVARDARLEPFSNDELSVRYPFRL